MTDAVTLLPEGGGSFSGLSGDIKDLDSILSTLFGKSQDVNTVNSGNTVTQETELDTAALDYTIRQMLEGNGSNSGLAALMTGEKAAGLYGASSSGLLANDLVARITGEIAKLTAKKTTTTSGSSSNTTTSTAGKAADLAKAAGLAAAMKAIQKALGGDKSAGTKQPSAKAQPAKMKAPSKGGGGSGNTAQNTPSAYTGGPAESDVEMNDLGYVNMNSSGDNEASFREGEDEGPEGSVTFGDFVQFDDNSGDADGDFYGGGSQYDPSFGDAPDDDYGDPDYGSGSFDDFLDNVFFGGDGGWEDQPEGGPGEGGGGGGDDDTPDVDPG